MSAWLKKYREGDRVEVFARLGPGDPRWWLGTVEQFTSGPRGRPRVVVLYPRSDGELVHVERRVVIPDRGMNIRFAKRE